MLPELLFNTNVTDEEDLAPVVHPILQRWHKQRRPASIQTRLGGCMPSTPRLGAKSLSCKRCRCERRGHDVLRGRLDAEAR